MAEENKRGEKRQTKAGMLADNGDRSESENSTDAAKNEPGTTPKMSKEKAENHDRERPPH